MKIFGAGYAGLIAGCYNNKAIIYEKNKEQVKNHYAVLRFKTDKVSSVTGIKFSKVKVTKSIWSNGKECFPTPRLNSLYSIKNTGVYENRSILNIDSCIRYIAPDNFFEMLNEELSDRVVFGKEIVVEDYQSKEDIISTLPLKLNMRMLGLTPIETNDNIHKIFINTFDIKNCNMFASIYYPTNETSVYRSSITGSELIIESKEKLLNKDLVIVLESLGIKSEHIINKMKDFVQVMGKMTAINDDERRMAIYTMSHDFGVYSLGRFALHKSSILLDDICNDIKVIKEMMMDDSYGISIMDRK